MKVFVTGGTGFIGANLIRLLLQKAMKFGRYFVQKVILKT
jgi:nucleoside-diphosphate-sugar epimerase